MKQKIDLIFIIIASMIGGMIGFHEMDMFAKPERKTSAVSVEKQNIPVLFNPVGKFHLNVDMNRQHVAFTGDNVDIEGRNPIVTVSIIPPVQVINPVKKEVIEVPVRYYMPLSQMPSEKASFMVSAASKPTVFHE